MPAEPGVPTPTAVLGDIAGAPGKLPHSKEVYDYMRRLDERREMPLFNRLAQTSAKALGATRAAIALILSRWLVGKPKKRSGT